MDSETHRLLELLKLIHADLGSLFNLHHASLDGSEFLLKGLHLFFVGFHLRLALCLVAMRRFDVYLQLREEIIGL